MSIHNQIHDDPGREAYYAQRHGIREIWFSGGDERQSFSWIYENDGKIIARIRDVFNWDNDEIDDFEVMLEPTKYLEGLGSARVGEAVSLRSLVPTIDGLTSYLFRMNALALMREVLKAVECKYLLTVYFSIVFRLSKT